MNLAHPLVVLALLAAPSWAGAPPEGSFKGTTPLVKGRDVMALLLREDPKDKNAAYALLAEYERVEFPSPERLQITRWVPRMYAYRVEETGRLRYALKRLRVSASGGLETDPAATPDALTLQKAGSMRGAVLVRYNKASPTIAETITFDGTKVSSTWEGFVPGRYFGSKDGTGGDYFKKDVNMVLSKDKVATYSMPDVQGEFVLTEKGPGLYTVSPRGSGQVGAAKLTGRIGVFVDIVNWKPAFTTDEFLLIDPEDPADLGFYYERH